MSNIHSAGPSALGYLYQLRAALVLFLRGDRERDVLVESLDDIQFDENGSPNELVQTKHRTTPASLSDASKDLWDSIRSWIFQIKSGNVRPNEVRLVLISTAIASDSSTAAALRPSISFRSTSRALEKLRQTARNSENKDNEVGYREFLNLSPEEQEALVESIHVFDDFPAIDAMAALLARELSLCVRTEFLSDFCERIEGWWFNRVISHLRAGSKSSILSKEILAQVHETADEYHQDSLPLHFMDAEVPADVELESLDKLFIHQLRLLLVRHHRIKKAVADFYRAFEQRSKWVRDCLILTGDLEKYESRLVDEWQRVFDSRLDELPANATEEDKQKAGRAIFNKIEMELAIPIRPKVTNPFVMRGSYHILSNSGRIGWHPEFESRLKELLEKARGAP